MILTVFLVPEISLQTIKKSYFFLLAALELLLPFFIGFLVYDIIDSRILVITSILCVSAIDTVIGLTLLLRYQKLFKDKSRSPKYTCVFGYAVFIILFIFYAYCLIVYNM